MRVFALAILMALISVPKADAAVIFGRDKLKGTTKTQADPVTPVCPSGTSPSNQGTDYRCIAQPTCPAGTTMQKGNLCVPLASEDVEESGNDAAPTDAAPEEADSAADPGQ